MTINAKKITQSPEQYQTISPVRALMWRLHFYAGILIAPVILWSAITGILYIFSPQIESIIYSNLNYVKPQTSNISYDEQLARAISFHPNGNPIQFTPSFAVDRSSEVTISTSEGKNFLIYVNPHTGEVLGQIDKSRRFINAVTTLHANLGASIWGRTIVELGTSWLLVSLLAGIILWFPKKAKQFWGIWLPRLTAKGKVFWRDLHSVTGIYLSGVILLLALTGLVWTQFAGGMLAIAADYLGQGFPKNPAVTSNFVAGKVPLSLQELGVIIERQGISLPYRIELPKDNRDTFRIQTINNSYDAIINSTSLQVEQYAGTVSSKIDWNDYALIPKLKLLGIYFHEGKLFGLANQILCTVACLAIIFSVLSGAVLWWKRRPRGTYKISGDFSAMVLSKPLRAAIVTLCFCLPTVGISFLGIFLFDRLVIWLRNR